MTKMIFINLPVKDLAATERFYLALGFEKNEQFSNDQAISMMWSDAITFMLLRTDYFETFTRRPTANSKDTVGALFAISLESREAVDAITETAGKSGGKADVHAVQDLGFMYSRAFEDPDGHIFESVYMDMSAMPEEN